MPFRFRKIFKLGKGVRLNLSKGGISTSLGGPGSSLNLGKNGARPTVGLPGTGISFNPSASKSGNSTNKLANNIVALIVSAILICIIAVCCVGVIFMPSFGTQSTPIPPTLAMSIEQIIAATGKAAGEQTQAAMPTSTIIPTSTIAPTLPIEPTATIFIFVLQTEMVQTSAPLPTEPIYSTSTPLVLATQPAQSGNATCPCDGSLNCKDFSSHAQAQACYDYCKAQGYGDVHDIDGNDKDGLACESLP